MCPDEPVDPARTLRYEYENTADLPHKMAVAETSETPFGSWPPASRVRVEEASASTLLEPAFPLALCLAVNYPRNARYMRCIR